MQDAYYSETSAIDTGLIILIAQSRNTPAYLQCVLLEIVGAAIR